MSARRAMVILGAGVLAACHGSANAPAIPDCGPLGAHVATLVSGDRTVTARVVTALCTHDHWAAETRRCLGAAAERISVNECATKGMTPDAAERLTLRLTHLTMGGDLAVRAADVSNLDDAVRPLSKPAATCENAGLRLALGLQLLIEHRLPSTLRGATDGTVGLVTRAICARDRWDSAALDCARDAPPNVKGALDPCVAKLAPAQRDAWISEVLRAIDQVERDIAAGKAAPGAIWSGTVDASPVPTQPRDSTSP